MLPEAKTTKRSMNLRSSSRCQNGTLMSPQSSPPDEAVVQRKLRGRKQRMGKPQAADSAIDLNKDEERDRFDLLFRTCDVGHDPEEARGVAGVVTDSGLQESDEDSASTCSSIVSGPSVLDPATPKKLCPGCLRLYKSAVTDKTPVQDKLLNNDPLSLTCDQWVLLKKWTPRRGSNLRGKSLSQLQFDKHVEVEGSPVCSRPHPFLQRNLRCVRNSAKKTRGKKSGKKRTRKVSQELCSAKQQRLDGENVHQHNSSIRVKVVSNISQYISSQMETDPSGEVISSSSVSSSVSSSSFSSSSSSSPSSSSIMVKTSELRAAQPELNPPKEARGFRNLLIQLRGSVIVRETH